MSQSGIIGTSTSNPAPVVIKSSPVNLKSVSSTVVFTPTSNFVVSSVVIYSTTLVGTPDFVMGSMGTNAPDYDNYNSIAPTFSNMGEFYIYTNNFFMLDAGTSFYINITTADTMSTTDLATVYIQGFYA